MKFCALVFELHFPRGFRLVPTDTQAFSKNSQIVFKTFQSVKRKKKIESLEFLRKQYFFSLFVQKKVKKIQQYPFVIYFHTNNISVISIWLAEKF